MKRFLIALCLSLAYAMTASAAPSYRSTVTAAKTLRKSELKLAKSIASLSAADREKLKKALATLGLDSDKDGVSDIFEKARGSDVCDSDSDDDGVDDGEDDYEEDGDRLGEIETTGAVESFEDPTLVVGERTYTVTSKTLFRKGISSKAGLTPGACIKVEGYVTPDEQNFATKIEKYSRCSDGNNGGGDGGGNNGGGGGGDDNGGGD